MKCARPVCSRLVATVRSHWFLILWLGVILGATLVPFEGVEETPPFLCVLCADGTVADGALNAALFLPLGAALSIVGWRPLSALALGAGFSLSLETAQFVIPGRDPSLSDVLFDTLGTALGIALARSTSLWWRPKPRVAEILSIAGALVMGSVLALTGLLLGPSFPEDTYYGGLAPRFGHLEWYGGRVLEVTLDGLEIPSGVIASSAEVRQRLVSEATIHVRARAGPRPPGLAPLFTIHDGNQREILLLGVDGDDVVYRYRTRATAWGLIGPEIRARGALRRIAWRDPLFIRVHRDGSRFRVSVNMTEHCGLGYTSGIGWTFLLGGQSLPLWLQPALNVGWLAVLLFLAGRWVRFSWASASAIVLLLASLLMLPPFVGLLPTPGTELVGALCGFLAGCASRATVRQAL